MGSPDLSLFWFPPLGRNDLQLPLFMYTPLVSRGRNLFPSFQNPEHMSVRIKISKADPFRVRLLLLARLTRGSALFWLWKIICPTGGPQIHFLSTCLGLPSQKWVLPLKLGSFSLCQVFSPLRMRDIAIELGLPQPLLLWAFALGS